MESLSSGVTHIEFLNAELPNFRYETRLSPDECRLFHCAPDGSCRFALYFPDIYKSTQNDPYTLDIFLSCVLDVPQKITVGVELKGRGSSHYVLESTQCAVRALAEKICQVLNCHQPSLEVLP